MLRKLFGKINKLQGNECLEVRLIPVAEIFQNPYQPRRYFDHEQMEELKRSVTSYGVIVPIVARKTDYGYEIVCGERRVRACKELSIASIPAIIRDLSPAEMLELAFIENAHRENLSVVEEAESYGRIQNEFQSLSEKELAQKLGKSVEFIQMMRRIMGYSPVVKKALMMELITTAHAEILSKLPDDEAMLVALKIIRDNKLSSEETALLVDSILDSVKNQNEAEGREKPDIDTDQHAEIH